MVTVPWVTHIRMIWRQQFWCGAVLSIEYEFQPQYPWSCRFCSSFNPNLNSKGILGLSLRSPAAWMAHIRNMWRQQCWCSAMLPVACLVKPHCPWSCRLCGSLNPNPNGGFVLRLRSSASWVAHIRKVWRQQCCCSALLHLEYFSQPHCPCRCRRCGSLKPNPKPNRNRSLGLRLRSPAS